MVELTKEDLQSVEGIIKSIASKFSVSFPFTCFEDLVQEGWKILYAWKEWYDPAKGVKFSTWFYSVYKRYLTSFVMKEYKKTSPWLSMDEMEYSSFSSKQPSPYAEASFNDMLHILKEVLSPLCFKLLEMNLALGKHASSTDLIEFLGVNERDYVYLQEELKTTSRYVLK